jgi:hypothetical protein
VQYLVTSLRYCLASYYRVVDSKKKWSGVDRASGFVSTSHPLPSCTKKSLRIKCPVVLHSQQCNSSLLMPKSRIHILHPPRRPVTLIESGRLLRARLEGLLVRLTCGVVVVRSSKCRNDAGVCCAASIGDLCFGNRLIMGCLLPGPLVLLRIRSHR